jgi:uncharacterized oxidoreductase
MNLQNSTILITGGSDGIGLALAEQLLELGNTILICGRSKEKLEKVKQKHPKAHTFPCDVMSQEQRAKLFIDATAAFPELNVLINNAGIQQDLNFRQEVPANLIQKEIDTNLTAYIHFCALFSQHLQQKKEAAIINISSGLAFIPITAVPVYCATKAAIHIFSVALRHQLKNTPVKVFEIAPPTVDSHLNEEGREKRGMRDRGIKPEEFAKPAIEAIQNDQFEACIGQAENLYNASKQNFEAVFERMNSH